MPETARNEVKVIILLLLLSIVLESANIVDENFRNNPSFRQEVFDRLSRNAHISSRYIAHFLLPYKEVTNIMINLSTSVEERSKEVFKRWMESDQTDKSWKYLRSLLIFLGEKSLVLEMEGNYEVFSPILLSIEHIQGMKVV